MIEWKEVTLEDRDAINSQICASGCHGADYSFANLFMWRKAYEPRIHFTDDRLLVGMPQINMYAYPKGAGDVRPSMELLLEEAHSRGEKLVIRGLTDRTLEEFLPLYGELFEIKEDRDNADYIYTVDRLCNLPGRHLASKRNHINKFLRNGDWELRRVFSDAEYEEARSRFTECVAGRVAAGKSDGGSEIDYGHRMTVPTVSEFPVGIATIGEAREFVDRFYEVKDDPELAAEADAIEEMFGNFDALGFRAALLCRNGKTVAFTAGTRLDEEVFDTHFEKALPDVDGAYTMINREFARMIAGEFPEIGAFNREEDMGLEGLRKAKLSYHPDILLMKYFAIEK